MQYWPLDIPPFAAFSIHTCGGALTITYIKNLCLIKSIYNIYFKCSNYFLSGPPSILSPSVYYVGGNGCLNVTISWDSATNNSVCGPVFYEVTPPAPNSVVTIISHSGEAFYTLDVFRFNARYNITVVGRNDAGVGEHRVISVSTQLLTGGILPQGKLYYSTI